MFEKWAMFAAEQIKAANPEETAPMDVLVFGLTIMFNIIFTVTIIMGIGWLLGVPSLLAQITISFMLARILTGGAHLDRSLACSLTSISLIILASLLPVTPFLIYAYVCLSLILLLRFAPYYEADQLRHSQAWENKKKATAILWVLFTLAAYRFLGMEGLVLGVFLQALLLTPAGIAVTHKLNNLIVQGGERSEKNS